MPTPSRLLKELRHEPVKGRSIFTRPDVQSSPQRSFSSQLTPPSSPSAAPARERRATRAVPAALIDQCTICIEEQLFSQAFALLASGLSAGRDTNTPACIPPPQHLALASTVAVHPSMTTRTADSDKHAAADDAVKYLRDVLSAVAVEAGGLREALQLERSASSRLDRLKRMPNKRSDTMSDSDDARDPCKIRSKYASKQSLAENADDFWAVVGWAFNCSVKHKARWHRWRIWLELMLDTLQKDLDEHRSHARAASNTKSVSKLLIAQYMSTIAAGSNNVRRVMRAVLADGSEKSLREFGEIWKSETSPPKEQEEPMPAKRRKLNLDNDEYGDYLDNDSEEDMADSMSRSSRAGTTLASRRNRNSRAKHVGSEDSESESGFEDSPERCDAIEDFGGMDAIRLRQRFLAILISFSRIAPRLFMDNEELFAVFTEYIRPLPLRIFQQFALPSRPYLSAALQISFSEALSRPLLGLKLTHEVMDQTAFEASFASCTAMNLSYIDNAKVNLLSESMLRALWSSGQLTQDLAQLRSLVDEGIKSRQEKAASNRRKKLDKRVDVDEEARLMLECSGQRMRLLLDTIVG